MGAQEEAWMVQSPLRNEHCWAHLPSLAGVSELAAERGLVTSQGLEPPANYRQTKKHGENSKSLTACSGISGVHSGSFFHLCLIGVALRAGIVHGVNEGWTVWCLPTLELGCSLYVREDIVFSDPPAIYLTLSPLLTLLKLRNIIG